MKAKKECAEINETDYTIVIHAQRANFGEGLWPAKGGGVAQW